MEGTQRILAGPGEVPAGSAPDRPSCVNPFRSKHAMS